MPTTIPAISGRIGSTDYWVTTMKAKELCERLVIPKDMDGWDDLSLEERYQRDININRVKKEIAPYFATDPNRFTGSLIVAIQNADTVEFEQVTEVAKNMPALYKQSASGLGLLTLSGGEILVPLDGQHRTKAIKYAITGRDENNKSFDFDQNTDLAQEDIVVILVKYDARESRRIFNKVNRYARPTSKGQNLITDDDDVVAVIVRQHVVGDLINPRLVNFQTASLNKRTPEFTALATLYEGSQNILKMKGHKADKSKRPDPAEESLFKKEIVEVWKALFEGIETVRVAIGEPGEAGDDKRREIRRDSILGKPIGQLSLVYGAMALRYDERFGRQSLPDVVAKLDGLAWGVNAALWQGVLLSGSRMRAGKTAAALGGDLVAFAVGGNRLSRGESNHLRERIKVNLTEDEAKSYRLPDPIGL